ncbi:MAG TPA: hypothetical protein PK598_09765 [Thermoanaerobaculia bacterium]|nr:hypothetical protein [Thermoanaerobaculia bacterium]
MRRPPRIGLLLGSALVVASGAARAGGVPPLDPELLARRVARNQELVERRWGGATYDLLEVRTRLGKDGRPTRTGRRLFYVLAGENGGDGTRELVEVDGRPATPEEVREATSEDAKRHRRLEERAAKRTAAPPEMTGDEDPLVGDRRLSELLARYELTFVSEEVLEGRPVYVLDFAARPGLPAQTLADRALAALEGRVVIDAADLQVASLEARLTRDLKVAGGLAASVKDARVVYRAARLGAGLWFPCRVDLHVAGKKAVFFRLDTAFRFEFANLKSFRVETEAVVGGPGEPRSDPSPP